MRRPVKMLIFAGALLGGLQTTRAGDRSPFAVMGCGWA